MAERPDPDYPVYAKLRLGAADNANNWTTGVYFFVGGLNSKIWGVELYNAIVTGLPRAAKVCLWEPGNAVPVRTENITLTAVGEIVVEFTVPGLDDGAYKVDGAKLASQNAGSNPPDVFGVSIYAGGRTTNAWVGYGLNLVNYWPSHFANSDNFYGAGDVRPKTPSGGGHRFYIAPIIKGNEDLADPDPPFLDNRQPAPNSHGVINPSNGHIEMDIVDLDTGVEKSTILVKISNSDGVLTTAYNGSINPPDGTFYNPFNGPLSSIGEIIPGSEDYRIVFDRIADFPSYQNVEVNVYAKDEAENILNETYYFHIEDYEPPVYYSPSLHPPRQNPEITGQSENTWIRAGIYDKGSGIDASSVHMYIDGIDAYNGLSGFVPGYDTHSTFKTHIYDGYDGYEITIYKNTRYKSGDTISVEVYATDNEGN